ncbi:DDE transposase [bacterium (Candidatus Howlettbacteria) CG_4_10_14_0_8_um_filter_40_9]|nr:MAG: DDE transposase [bacterium (Candidatus Howlettbacteria) CG_4_10_14_0_8_um_filter_40_9]
MPTKEFEKQYKNHLSGFKDWDQLEHADEWLLFSDNIGKRMSIDEVAVSNGELYTIITNKNACGGKGSLASILSGTKASSIVPILTKIPLEKRNTVEEVTLDMSHSMDAIVRNTFPKSTIVIDRFHVQKLVSEAVQEIRIELRREALKEENESIRLARKEKQKYRPATYKNGDTKKQLLARSRYLLFKSTSKWTESQKERSIILFKEFPELKEAYEISMMFRSFYEHNQTKNEAKEALNKWYEKVEEKQIESFTIVAESIRLHENNILNYFTNRSTNAGAELFNTKLKGFRGLVRGVRDKKFFLFRVSKLYG